MLKNKVILLIILCCSFVPLLATVFSPSRDVSYENRELDSFPSWLESIKDPGRFPQQLKKAFEDQFYGKDLLVLLNNYISIEIFGFKSIKNTVKGEKDNWFFFKPPGSQNPFLSLEISKRYSVEERRAIKKHFEEKLKIAKRYNKKYVFVLVPNKLTVYGQNYRHDISLDIYRRAYFEIRDILSEVDDLILIDSLDVLEKVSTNRPLYQETGTHWNLYAASFVGASVVTNLLGLSDVNRPKYVWSKTDGHDLVEMLNLHTVYRELTPKETKQRESCISSNNSPYGNIPVIEMINTCKSVQRSEVLFFRDSFGGFFMSFLADYFNRVLAYYIQPDIKVFEDELKSFKGDFVIEQRVERFFLSTLW